MKYFNLKTFVSSLAAIALLSGCTSGSTGNQTIDNNQRAIIGTTIGALAGIALGNNIGGGSKSRNKTVGALAGAAIGGYIGYRMDQQAKEVADSLNTTVNNNPNAVLDPSQDLIVSHTDNYVKIMFRDDMMFATNSSIPTQSAKNKIAKVNSVLQKYPNTIVQVVGHTDSRGTYQYNKTLSEKRATNVGNTIYNSGVKNQIFSKGCSFSKPVAPNTNSTNMALNRRVEVFLYSNASAVIDTCK
ncbi:OmpA family protein [Arcobacter sp. YIC-80]|uniref:OmpA family protein n=1 Tax=unclassified Arcobacter TaxID=2593671 RepID=UPI00385085E4